MQTESRSTVAWRLGRARNDGKEELQRDIKKLSVVMDILILMMSSWCVCMCVWNTDYCMSIIPQKDVKRNDII